MVFYLIVLGLCEGVGFFSHRIVSLLKNLDIKKRIRLSPCFRADLLWWKSFASFFNGSASIVTYNFGDGPMITTDASLHGYGFCLHAGTILDWQAGWFNTAELPNDFECIDSTHHHWKNIKKPLVTPKADNINFFELLPVWQSVLRFGPYFRGHHLVVLMDNTQVISMVNCGKSINISCMCLLREIFWLCIMYDVYITARHVLVVIIHWLIVYHE